MRILFLIRSLNIGGAEKQLITLSEELLKINVQFEIVTFYSGGDLEQKAKRAGINIISLDKKSRWDLIGFFARLHNAIKDYKPDIICSYLTVPNIVASVIGLLFPKIKIVWNIRSANMELKNYDITTRLTYKIEMLFSKLPDKIIFNSNEGYDYASSLGYRNKNIEIIYNGIDCNTDLYDEEDIKAIKTRYGIGEKDTVIATVARLDAIKGHEHLIQAAAKLTNYAENIIFIIAGSGDSQYEKKLQRLISESNLQQKVKLIGSVENPAPIYAMTDIYVSASLGEGFPNSVCEAMIHECPCVVTDVGDCKRIVADCGTVVPSADSSALAEGIERLLHNKNEAATLGAKARKRIIDNYSTEKLCDNFIAQMNELVGD